MKSRIIAAVTVLILVLGAIPAWMSYQIDQTVDHYVPAAKHVYLFASNDCDGNLESWTRFNLRYILTIMQTTQQEFKDTAHLDRLLSDKTYLAEHQNRFEDLIIQFWQTQEQYTADSPPYFCNANVAEIHDAVIRMNDRHVFFYVAVIAQDNEKAKSRLKGLDDVINVIFGAMEGDAQLKPIIYRVMDELRSK